MLLEALLAAGHGMLTLRRQLKPAFALLRQHATAHETMVSTELPLADLLQSLARQQAAHWSREKWESLSATLLRSVRTTTPPTAELVKLLRFWAKACAQDSREISNPEWNDASQLLTTVVEEISLRRGAASESPELLQALCSSCLELQLELPARFAEDLLLHASILSGHGLSEPELLALVAAVSACAQSACHAGKLGSVVRRLFPVLRAARSSHHHALKKLLGFCQRIKFSSSFVCHFGSI